MLKQYFKAEEIVGAKTLLAHRYCRQKAVLLFFGRNGGYLSGVRRGIVSLPGAGPVALL